MGTTTLEDVAGAAREPNRHMFQLYVIKDRSFTQQLVQARLVDMTQRLISEERIDQKHHVVLQTQGSSSRPQFFIPEPLIGFGMAGCVKYLASSRFYVSSLFVSQGADYIVLIQ